LAGKLRVQIASPVDVADEIVSRSRRACDGHLRTLRLGAQLLELAPARLEPRARGAQLCQRTLMFGNAAPIEVRERGDGARGLADPPQVGRREEQTEITGLSEFVHLDEPGSQGRPLGEIALFERAHAGGDRRELARDLLVLAIDAPEFLSPDLAIDL